MYALLVDLGCFFGRAEFRIDCKAIAAYAKTAQGSVARQGKTIDHFDGRGLIGDEFMADPESCSHGENLSREPQFLHAEIERLAGRLIQGCKAMTFACFAHYFFPFMVRYR